MPAASNMTTNSPSEPKWPATYATQFRGTKVDAFPLVVVNLKNLLKGDKEEARKLYEGAQSPGFFWVDLRDSRQYVDDLQAIYAMMGKYFEQPEESKLRDFIKDDEFQGYKPDEFASTLELLRDRFVQKTVVLPEILQADAEILERFVIESHNITYTLISSLSDSLGLDTQSSIEHQHPYNGPSYTSLLLANMPTAGKVSDYPDNQHTDYGLITLNFIEEWGMQIELPWNKQWATIVPKSGHTLVNVSNTLQSLTGNKLHSCQHRVTQFVDGVEKRSYVGYLLRPVLG